MQKITKAVFPVAGMGTRFLPATKASPKEMLCIVDKPLIQYAVEEALSAGITELIFITGRNKRAIEDHFDKAYELERELEDKGKEKLLNIVQSVLPKGASCVYVRQQETLGLGHAILCAKSLIGNEPFAVLLADDLWDSEPPAMRQMAELFYDTHCSILGVQEVPHAETERYGIVKVQEDDDGLNRVMKIIEKPKPEQAPSNLAVAGRYILTPRIFEKLQTIQPGAGGELQLTDAIAGLLKHEFVIAQTLKGHRYDCGSKMGYMQANVNMGLKHHEIGADFKAYLETFGCKF